MGCWGPCGCIAPIIKSVHHGADAVGRCVCYEVLVHSHTFCSFILLHIPSRGKTVSRGSSEVCLVPFSAALRPLVILRARTGVRLKVKEERITQDTLQIKESGR